MKRIFAGTTLAVLMLFVFGAQIAFAAGLRDDRVIFGGSTTVASGETVNGDLVVFGGSAEIQEGAEVTGDVLVFGGDTTIAGTIGGDVISFGGSGTIEDTAEVGGQLVTLGGGIRREEGATIRGGEAEGFIAPPRPGRVSNPRFSFGLVVFRPFLAAWNILIQSIVLGVLALLLMTFLPAQTTRVADTITHSPAPSGGMGLLTVVAVPVLMTIMAITICLIPLTAIAGVVLFAAWLMGWISIGLIAGSRMAGALNWHRLTPAAAGALGTFVFSLVALALGRVPFVGWLVPTLTGLLGLGAVTLTRFGTRTYFTAAPMPPVAPPPSPESAEAGS